MIDFGANIHSQNVAGNTPLHICATRNFKESVKWLLQRGCDPLIKNKSGKTALDLAEQACSEDCITLLKKWDSKDVSKILLI